jgi:hypothetical protein
MDLHLHFTTKGNALDQLCLQSVIKQVSSTVALAYTAVLVSQTRSSVAKQFPQMQISVIIMMISQQILKFWFLFRQT